MKNALKIALGLILALGIVLPAAAQQAGPRGGQQGQGQGRGPEIDPAKMQQFRTKMEAKRAAIFKELKLTAKQITDIKAADKKQQDAMAKLRPQGQGRPSQEQMEKMRTQFQAIRKTWTDSMVKIMTKAKFDTYQKRMREESEKVAKELGIQVPRGMGGGRPGGGRPGGGL
jgi:hypothetical protein